MAKNVLVTGANGFIGANLVRHLLSKGYKVHILLRKNSNTWRIDSVIKKLKIHSVDIRNQKSVNTLIKKIKPVYIYHLASFGAYPFQQDIHDIIETNVSGTIGLLKACINLDSLDAFINAGSSAEYGFKSHPMKETDFIEPSNAYGAAKASQTLWCQYFASNYSLPVIVFRPSLVYGYYEEPTRLIPDTIISHLRKRPLILSSPFPKKDFVFIEDVLRAIDKLEGSKKYAGQIFNIASGKEYSVGEVVFLIRRLIKSDIPYKWGGKEGRIWDTDTTWVDDVSKAKRLLNWEAKHSFEKGLLKSIDWFKKNKKLYP